MTRSDRVTGNGSSRIPLAPLDSLTVDVITDDVSDNYVSKTLFAVSEFANIVRAGAKALSGEALLCANLGFGCRLVSAAAGIRHTMLFDTGPEGAIFLRNCANLGIALGEIECIAVSHGHWDHMAALPAALDAIRDQGGKATVHVNPGMFNERAVQLSSGTVVPAAEVPSPTEMEALGAMVVNDPCGAITARRPFLFERRDSDASAPLRRAGSITSAAPAPKLRGSPIRC